MNPQIAQIESVRAYVLGELDFASARSDEFDPVSIVSGSDTLRECSICERAMPAEQFRAVVGRITTEACGDCCDRRESFEFPVSSFGLKEFCLRVAEKRFRRTRPLTQAVLTRYHSTKIEGSSLCGGPVGDSRSAGFLNNGKKGESALAKSPEEYAKWLQRFPDRVAAIVAKTYAVKGDAYEKTEDQALIEILDLLNDGDESLIARNAEKKLARQRRPS